ncbi:hypothetical protein PSPO01_01790 [Paraphaeosphaeria sporulosa]
MADAGLTLTVKRHTKNLQRGYLLDTYCDNSDGANFCSCQRDLVFQKPCMFYGRNLEPLAFSIAKDRIHSQAQSTLVTGLPIEIREMIWGYALTDTTSVPAHGTFMWRSDKMNGKPKLPVSDIAFGLVESCKAVYLETYRLPLQLNYYTVYDFQGPFFPNLEILAPWQAALIQRLDISLQQIALERGELRNWLKEWAPEERHQGAYIEPRFLHTRDRRLGRVHHREPFPFNILSAAKIGKKDPRDGDELTLGIAMDIPDTEHNIFYELGTFATHFKARAMVARPLTHLTIRLTHQDWWNWSVDSTAPSYSPGPHNQLYLEPLIGEKSPSVIHSRDPGDTSMDFRAARQRPGEDVGNGRHGGWGTIVERLPDLKELKLVLETFDVKKDSLDTIVDCAKAWRFPIEKSSFELTWDGEVEDASWEIEPGDLDQNYNESLIVEEGEVENDEDRFTEDEQDSEDSYDSSEDEGHSEDEETYDPPPPPLPSWHSLVTRFEVRVVRFVRRKRGQPA